MRLARLVASTEEFLKAAGVPSPRVDAEILIGHVLDLSRGRIYLEATEEIAPTQEAAVWDLARRRASRVPLQYLVRELEFMSLPFTIRPGVFIPRPESELLVETLMEKATADCGSYCILDVGTGCGVLAVALARYLQPRLVLATDISMLALETARENAIINGVEDLVGLVAADALSFLNTADRPKGGQFNLVACNPPYVESGVIEALEPEVRDYEPRQAIDGGVDGLAFIERIVPGMASVLKRDGWAALEIGAGQGVEVADMFRRHGLEAVKVLKDLAGLDRVVMGRRA